MKYDFHAVEELAWVAVVAAGLVALQALAELHPDAITDWRPWGIALGGAVIRAAAGAVIAYVTRPKAP